MVESNGFEFINRYLDECRLALEPLLVECYRRLVATRAPVFAYYEWSKPDWRRLTGAAGACETGFTLFSRDGTRIDGAISIIDSEAAVPTCRRPECRRWLGRLRSS